MEKQIKNVALVSMLIVLLVMSLAMPAYAAMKAQVTGGAPLKNVAATGDSIKFDTIEVSGNECTITNDSGWTMRKKDDSSVNFLTRTFSKGKTDLNLSLYFNERLKVGKKKYDIKMDVKSLETTANKCFVALNTETPGIRLNVEFNVNGNDIRPSSDDREGSNEMGVEIQIFDSETKEPAVLPGVFFSMRDLDGDGDTKAEAWTIEGYTPNNTNAYVDSVIGQYIKYKGNTIYGTRTNESTDVAYAAVDTMRNGGVTKLYYAGIAGSGLQGNYGSTLHFYETAHEVKYTSDENGTVSGITNEDVVDYGNPSGSQTTPKESYRFTHWTCDKDVNLEDGTTITAGSEITDAQIKNIVVLEDLTFTAHHGELFSVDYQWEGEHPNVEPPEGQTGIAPGESHEVDNTFVKGETKVREPKDGQDGYYLFEGWDKDGTIEINENTTIKGTWSFHPLYKITTDVEHGTITENIVDIEENETKQVDFAPDNGYQLKTLTVDGENKNIHQYTDNYVFEQINEDHTIKAVFEKIPELSIIKRADKESISSGRTVSYTIELAQVNPGAEARDVVVRDSMPEGVKLIVGSLELPHGAVLNSADEDGYSFTLPSLEDGVMYTYSAKTSAEIEGDLVNTVYASGSNVPENKEDSATVKTVKPEAAVEKNVSNETPEYNESFVYTIKMKQTKEGGIMENAVLTDKIPEEIEVDEDSIHVSDQDAEVSFKNNVLTVKKDELLREIVITFNAKATTYEGTIKNVAKLTGSNVADAEDDADITIKEPKVKLTKTINKKNVKKGDTVKYTIVADVTEATAVNARIKDIVPYGIEVQKNSITCNKDGAKIEFKDGVITINFEKVKGKIIFTFKGRVTVDNGKVKNLVSFNAANFSDGPVRANAVFKAKTEEEPEEDEDEVEEIEKERETSQTGDDIMKYCIIGGIALVLLIGALVLRNKSNK